MIKKHFIALADSLRPVKDELTASVVMALCSFIKEQNGAFMQERWIDYLNGKCGPNGGKR